MYVIIRTNYFEYIAIVLSVTPLLVLFWLFWEGKIIFMVLSLLVMLSSPAVIKNTNFKSAQL